MISRRRRPSRGVCLGAVTSSAGFLRSWLSLACLLLCGAAHGENLSTPSTLPPEARQFDFWIGEWDVTLRVQQEDRSWVDEVRSVAKIYPILGGKAVLELWSDERLSGIKGYSLRYFDVERQEWVLWLNWPGDNTSGSSSLAGTFRHGRGEFFASRPGPDGAEVLSRFTFSDVTADSLRWDDAFSRDGGKTWTHGWIMEFTRRGGEPSLAPQGGPAHTFHSGVRCDAEPFRTYEFLVGRHSGVVKSGGAGEVEITGHQVLDGCAVVTFVGASSSPERASMFSHLTWNTFASRYELTLLTSEPESPARIFYSTGDSLELYESASGAAPGDRLRIEPQSEGGFLWVLESPDAGEWRAVWSGLFR